MYMNTVPLFTQKHAVYVLTELNQIFFVSINHAALILTVNQNGTDILCIPLMVGPKTPSSPISDTISR